MSAVSTFLTPDLASRWMDAFDRERKVARALDELGSLAGGDVAVVDIEGGPIEVGLAARGVRLTHAEFGPGARLALADEAVDAVVGAWSSFQAADPDELAEAERVVRPGGRLLVAHDYGRDDMARLLGDRPEFTTWSRRGGPFTESGFRIRVVHAHWTFGSLEDATAFLDDVFGAAGVALAAGLHRPRLTHNIAIYHRTASRRPD